LTSFLSVRRGLLWSIAVLRIMQAREFLLAIVVYPNFLVPH
jgi:hypothetical protein